MYKEFNTDFINAFHDLRSELLQILLETENYKTAVEEYRRSERTLLSVNQEKIPVELPSINQYAAYLPYNNVLYSYILYALIPSLLTQKVFIRPSHLSSGAAIKIDSLLRPFFNNIFLKQWSRREFLHEFVNSCNVVAFTGKYSNLPEVADTIQKNQMLVYGGDGLVSFIVHDDADIERAVKGAIRDRLYASGQDCICPDIFLIHESIAEKFIRLLTTYLQNLKFGPHIDEEADYSPILKEQVVLDVNDFLTNRRQRVIFGGDIDFEKRIIPPTILLENDLLNYEYFEFYSPVFRVYKYKSLNDIIQFYSLPFQEDFKMGASVFGGKDIVKFLKHNKIIASYNQTFFDVENGNKPFGGYGIRASHALFNGSLVARPILVSSEIKRYLNSFER